MNTIHTLRLKLRKTTLCVVASVLATLAACTSGGRIKGELPRIDSLTETDQRAAIARIDSIKHSYGGRMGRSDEMKLALLRAKAANKLSMPLSRDSLRLMDGYFNDNGTPNERMLIKYITGCSYLNDKEKADSALECFHEAAECADTNSVNCDWRTLHKVHVQSAELLLRQYAAKYAMDENALAMKYALKAKDTFNALITMEQRAGIYSVSRMPDSAIAIRVKLYGLYKKHGYTRMAAICLGPLINILISKGDIGTAEQYIDIYEKKSGLFYKDKNTVNIFKGYEAYYTSKANYFLATGKGDSAEFYYRKGINTCKTFGVLKQNFAGLAALYKKLHRIDSVAKYAELSRQMNDSAFAHTVTTHLQQMQAAYDYGRFKLETEEAKKDASEARWLNIVIIIAAVFTLSAFLLAVRTYIIRRRKKVKAEILRYERNICELKKMQREYVILAENRQARMEHLLQEKKLEIERLQQEKTVFEEKHGNDARFKLSDEPIIKIVRNRARKDFKCLTAAEYAELKAYFSAYKPLSKWDGLLNDGEYQVCLLVRLDFTPAEIGVLTKMSPSNISNIRKRLYMKMAGRDGSPKDFDNYIKSL